MSDLAIRADGLAKRYRLGKRQPYGTLRDVLGDVIASHFHRLAPWRRKPPSEIMRQPREDSSFWALKDVSFEVRHGEAIGIIGYNGAGKSTLLKVLTRVTPPTAGYVEIHGRVGSLLEVGTGFHPELTGRENIFLNGTILGMSRSDIRQRFDEIVSFAGIEQFIDTPVKRYSSGMYVRLAFAVAAHLEPDILIVDEVLAVGDAAFQRKCLGKMGEAAGEGRTVLFVSHNMAAVQALCQRGILLRKGSVWKDVSVTDAVSGYLQSLEQAAQQDLLERTERHGKGEVRLMRVTVSTADEQPADTLVTGRSARLVFHLSSPVKHLSVVFTIYDYLGQPVANFNSAVHSPEDTSDPASGTSVICWIDDLFLVPGRYRLNVAIYSQRELQDHVEGAAVFHVEPGTVRGRPVTSDTTYGRVCMPHRWILPT